MRAPMSVPSALPTGPAVSQGAATVLVVLASVGFGFVPFFARSLTEAGMAPHAVALYRYALAALVFLPFVIAARAQTRILAEAGLTGLAMGLGWVAYVRALEVVPVATAGVVYMTFPVFALIAARVLFGERPTPRGLLATATVALAAGIAAGPAAMAPAAAPVILLAFAAPATFGTAIAMLVHRLTPLPVLARMGAISLGSVAGLLPLVASTPTAAVLPADTAALGLVVGIALATAFVPQLLYTLFAPVVGAARAATAGAAELPTMMALGWLAFGETLSAAQALGGAMIVAAILLSPSRKVRGAVATATTVPRR